MDVNTINVAFTFKLNIICHSTKLILCHTLTCCFSQNFSENILDPYLHANNNKKYVF